jgi:hypothetical protein
MPAVRSFVISDYGASAAHIVADADPDVYMRGHDHINAGSKADKAEQLAAPDGVPRLFPADDAPRYQSRDLFYNKA